MFLSWIHIFDIMKIYSPLCSSVDYVLSMFSISSAFSFHSTIFLYMKPCLQVRHCLILSHFKQFLIVIFLGLAVFGIHVHAVECSGAGVHRLLTLAYAAGDQVVNCGSSFQPAEGTPGPPACPEVRPHCGHRLCLLAACHGSQDRCSPGSVSTHKQIFLYESTHARETGKNVKLPDIRQCSCLHLLITMCDKFCMLVSF